MVRVEEHLVAYGHPHVTATHRTTFEITREEELTPAGSCIIAIGSDKGAADLNSRFCTVLRLPGASLITTLTCGKYSITVRSKGDPSLELSHPTDLVWRRSVFTCNRTIGVCADHTAQDFSREMVSLLREGAQLEVLLVATCGD
ncbi:MAG: DUF371 domain-containing protein [Methanomicrobiales archaeon]|nr:DUF371 domain-containing protein [Methanomicrobiales archaeon]